MPDDEKPKGAVEEFIEYGTGKTPLYTGQRAKSSLIKTSIKQAVQYFELEHGKTAESLGELVQSGNLAEKYTLDEWNRKLISRFVDGQLEVRSMGPDKTAGTRDDWVERF